MKRQGTQCPAVAVGPLKADGRLDRCGNNVAPGEPLCHVHLARLDRGRLVLTLPWHDGAFIDRLEAFTKEEAAAHTEKVARARRAAEEKRMLEKGYVPNFVRVG